jgi:phage major head subunit gpT-like protein
VVKGSSVSRVTRHSFGMIEKCWYLLLYTKALNVLIQRMRTTLQEDIIVVPQDAVMAFMFTSVHFVYYHTRINAGFLALMIHKMLSSLTTLSSSEATQ